MPTELVVVLVRGCVRSFVRSCAQDKATIQQLQQQLEAAKKQTQGLGLQSMQLVAEKSSTQAKLEVSNSSTPSTIPETFGPIPDMAGCLVLRARGYVHVTTTSRAAVQVLGIQTFDGRWGKNARGILTTFVSGTCRS